MLEGREHVVLARRWASRRWLGLAAVAVVAIVGASRVFDPFSGDQALFFVGAETLHAGGTLYRDYWDIKQPGIFAFYLAACDLFGYTQVGAHVLEVLWQTAFAIALVFGLRGVLADRRWAAFAPLGVVCATYAGSTAWHLLQVEELVGFPIFICMWAANAAGRGRASPPALAFVSGVAAGIVLAFKLLLAPVVVAVVIAVRYRGRDRATTVDSIRFWYVWIAAAFVPLGIYAAYAIVTNSVAIGIETALVLPLRIASTVPHAAFDRLRDSTLHLLLYFRGVIVLAAIGTFAIREPAMRPWRAACLAWIVSGAAVILAQAQSYWQYHFLLLVPPLGILATFGAASLGDHVSRGGGRGRLALAASGVVALVAFSLPQGAIGTALRVVRERPFASIAALEHYRVATNTEYGDTLVEATLPRHDRRASAPIYVFGNPLLYVLARRRQAVAITNWIAYVEPPFILARLDDELAAARPAYIFVGHDRRNRVSPARSPRVAAMLALDYVEAARTPSGAWYRKRATTP